MTRTEKQTTARLPIGRILLIAFVVMPLIEIAVFIQVGGWIGLWPTLGLIVLTAIVGTWMLRRQGFAVLRRAQQQLEQGGIPLGEVFEGFCLVIAGALLLTPGFVTDAIGGALLLPPVRAWLYRALGGHLRAAAMPGGHRPPPGRRAPEGGPVVEGDYETLDDAEERDQGAAPGTMPPPRGSWDDKP
jgi:UPF0716 protein FxsA